jgi:hypothetical protein
MVPFEFDGGPFLPCAKLTFRLRYWDRADGLEPLMRIANQCQQRALVLLQIARDCPEIRDQAVYLAREWLEVAAVRLYCLDQIERIKKRTGPIRRGLVNFAQTRLGGSPQISARAVETNEGNHDDSKE